MDAKLILTALVCFSLGLITATALDKTAEPVASVEIRSTASLTSEPEQPAAPKKIIPRATNQRGEAASTKAVQAPAAAKPPEPLDTEQQQKLAQLQAEKLQRKARDYARLRRQANGDMTGQLSAQFEQQERDMGWSYQQENAINQALRSLEETPSIVSNECRASQCRIELITPRAYQAPVNHLLETLFYDESSKIPVGDYIAQADPTTGITTVYLDRAEDSASLLDQ
ncbi:hypothetical protein [Gilvimarinus algae]|uniref:Uncharacterized protein n=1 Tax=Gilvimarinus algae TaxID=3058037 RepID=A0ABT8TN86_9GAMM|nr:hypothetical protein [Gilvimarinus sp. SDUM040014]MDO3383862.1 hypothetical protein [Gilvimarinus sp. SDUM040014]